MSKIDIPILLSALDSQAFLPTAREVINNFAEALKTTFNVRIGLLLPDGRKDGALVSFPIDGYNWVGELGPILEKKLQIISEHGACEKLDWMFEEERHLYDAFVQGLMPILRLLYKRPGFPGVWWQFYSIERDYRAEVQCLGRTGSLAYGILKPEEVHTEVDDVRS